MNGTPPSHEIDAFLSLGSNLGDREETLLGAFARLDRCAGVRLEAASSLYETEPLGLVSKRPFVNAACVVATSLAPRELLSLCQTIEREFGRERAGPTRDRTLDIDIIAYGGVSIDEPDLAVPHPRLRERLFVLVPLAEIRPDAALPPDGKRVRDLLRECAGGGWARRVSSRGQAR